MKPTTSISIVGVFSFALLLLEAGCEPAPPVHTSPPAKTDSTFNGLLAYAHYVPVKINIIPLSEFARVSSTEGPSKIKVYVTLLDTFDSQVKAPGTFRFELYSYVPRTAEPKGKRIAIWPDINLTDSARNNSYWRDFLRAYEFDLDFIPQRNHSYVLQATYLSPDNRRLSADFFLKYAE